MENNQDDKDALGLEAYWSKRYKDQKIGWDLGNISDPLRDYFDQISDKTLKILIPGAGNAYEAEYLHRLGFTHTYIVDISELPLNNFRNRVPDFPPHHILQHDFFKLEDQFDIIIEQTFFCSIPPIDNNRAKYVQKMYDLLRPGGKLVGVWFNFPFSGDLSKRPFGGTKPEYLKLFSEYFKINVFEEAHNSVADRVGLELFGIFQK